MRWVFVCMTVFFCGYVLFHVLDEYRLYRHVKSRRESTGDSRSRWRVSLRGTDSVVDADSSVDGAASRQENEPSPVADSPGNESTRRPGVVVSIGLPTGFEIRREIVETTGSAIYTLYWADAVVDRSIAYRAWFTQESGILVTLRDRAWADYKKHVKKRVRFGRKA